MTLVKRIVEAQSVDQIVDPLHRMLSEFRVGSVRAWNTVFKEVRAGQGIVFEQGYVDGFVFPDSSSAHYVGLAKSVGVLHQLRAYIHPIAGVLYLKRFGPGLGASLVQGVSIFDHSRNHDITLDIGVYDLATIQKIIGASSAPMGIVKYLPQELQSVTKMNLVESPREKRSFEVVYRSCCQNTNHGAFIAHSVAAVNSLLDLIHQAR